MARIKDASVDSVKAAIDMVELVSAYTPLRRVGARYTARCPFHDERTPSFSVNAVDKLYYCFGCGAKGDAITFVREKENLDFAGAIEWLADRFRIPLEYEEASPEIEARRRRSERLRALLEQAAVFYERYLWESAAGEPARAYLTERGLGEEICRVFRLGLAPSAGRMLQQKAREKGFSDDELRAAGLLNRGGYDTFQGRLMFPLADARGRVLGFQARRLREDDPLAGKYVNSPEGELFQKGSILYGLHLARAAIAKQGRAVVVEGNTDVIALRQAGLEPVIASMGTALTSQQLDALWGLTTRLDLCFDADAAGQEATLRGMGLADKRGFDVRIVRLTAGKDPADDPAGFEMRLLDAVSYALHGVEVICEGAGGDQEKLERARQFLEPIEESIDRQEAVRYLTDRLRLPRELQAGLAPAARGRIGAVSGKVLEAGVRLERDALAGAIGNASSAEVTGLLGELPADHFDLELHRRVHDHLVAHGPADEEVVGVLAELDARAANEAIDEATAKELLLRLRERAIRRDLAQAEDAERIKELQASLAKIREAIGGLG